MAQEQGNIREREGLRVKDPEMYRVIMLNDDFTPMDFVVEVLTGIFRHDMESAERLMLEIHEKGSSQVGCYVYDIAQTKAVRTMQLARENDYPLRVKVEKE